MTSYLKDLDYSVVQQCMHCGMCLPTCPTYRETGMEKNSPRGRIALMRAVADEELEVTKAFADEMYYCLGCLACTTACPAGVNYPELFEMARAEVEEAGVLDHPQRRFWRWLSLKLIFTRPRLLRLIGRMLRLYQVSGMEGLVRKSGVLCILPKNLRELEPTTPKIGPAFSDDLIAEVEEPQGEGSKYRVGLLTGCVQDLILADVNRDTADVLLQNGCTVVTLRNQGCCGSLHGHNGAVDLAKQMARQHLDRWDLDCLDAIISNAAGCGSHLKHYGPLLKDDAEYADRAKQWDRLAKDINEWLVEIDFRKPTGDAEEATQVTYHEACHLCHGQKITQQPRAILNSIPGLNLNELKDSTLCCGSAGIYNITQPEQAGKLQDEKVANIVDTCATVTAVANPGCHLQIENGLKDCGASQVRVAHPITLLAEAYRAEGD